MRSKRLTEELGDLNNLGPLRKWLETVFKQSSKHLVALETVLRWLETVLRWLETVLKWLEEVLNMDI